MSMRGACLRRVGITRISGGRRINLVTRGEVEISSMSVKVAITCVYQVSAMSLKLNFGAFIVVASKSNMSMSTWKS